MSTTAIVPAEQTMGLSKLAKPDDIRDFFNDPEIEMAPSFVTLGEDCTVTGYFVGKGSVEVEDRNTGEVKSVATLIVEIEPRVRVEFLSAHELERQSATWPMDGTALVKIYRGRDERTPKGTMTTKYLTGIKRNARASGAK